MLSIIMGSAMMISLIIAVYLGFKEQYNATEGTLAMIVLLTFFCSIGLVINGIITVA